MDYSKVINFWFDELDPKDWYKKDSNLDKKIADEFGEVFLQATRGELSRWRETIEGRLAEIIVLDQFSRNIYRGDKKSFEFDIMALVLSQEASKLKEVDSLTNEKKAFLYMPFMHSESLVIHEEAVKLFSNHGLKSNLEYEIKHKNIIEKFGRYPHRNKILGRESTSEELEFLKGPGSSF